VLLTVYGTEWPILCCCIVKKLLTQSLYSWHTLISVTDKNDNYWHCHSSHTTAQQAAAALPALATSAYVAKICPAETTVCRVQKLKMIIRTSSVFKRPSHCQHSTR